MNDIANANDYPSQDFLGFWKEAIVEFATFEQAKALGWLAEGASPEGWGDREPTRDQVLSMMGEYMEFAWGKVRDHRGLSTSRSVAKMEAWAWLLSDEDHAFVVNQVETNWGNYGAGVLRAICERFGFPWPETEEWAQRMAAGETCRPDGCDEGCGR